MLISTNREIKVLPANMLPSKKPSITPANQTPAPLQTLNNLASQIPVKTTFKFTDPYPPPPKHPQQPSIPPVTLSLLTPVNQTRNVQNNNPPSNTTFPVFAPSKFFFERFPSWLDYHDLKKRLSKISHVTNLFISRKKTSRGRRFGFVSFLSTLKESEICDSLNLIWFDSYKIRANPVRFQKDPERKKPDLVIKPQPQPKAMPKLTFRDSRTFVEALSDTKHPKKTVYYESIPDDKEWLLRSLVGSINTNVDYAHLEHMVLKNIRQTVGFRFLGASQAVITFSNRESMEKELVNGSSVLKTSFSHLKPWKKGAKATDRFVWVSILGLPLIGWNRRCIESIIEKAGKMVGYDITSVSQGSLTGVKVLLSTTSFETLNEHVLLVLDGDEFDISIMEMKPDFCPLLSTIKHSMDITATLDEESCSDFATSDEVTTAGLKTTDPGGDLCATNTTITEQ